MEARKTLDIRQTISSRKQELRFISRTRDDKLIFQGVLDGAVLTTDLEGYRVDSKNKVTKQKIAYNALPDDIVIDSARIRFNPGDIVYTVRPLSKRRKLYAGTVVGYSNAGLQVKLEGIPESQWKKQKVKTDGSISVPTRMAFSTKQAVLEYIDSFRKDLELAFVDHMRLTMTAPSAQANG